MTIPATKAPGRADVPQSETPKKLFQKNFGINLLFHTFAKIEDRIMLGIKTKKQVITGKYAKRLTELISRGQAGSHKPTGDNQTDNDFLSKEKYEVVWE